MASCDAARPRAAGARRRPVVGLTLGDPGGIGPEILLRALARPSVRRRGRFVVLGGVGVLRRVAQAFGLETSFLRPVRRFALPREDEVAVWAPCPVPTNLALRARPSADGGRAAVGLVERGIELAMAGRLDALVTAPLSKEAVALAGLPWPGHTELLAARTGARHAVMTMVGGGLRVALATTHVPLSRVERTVTRRRLLETIRTFAAGLSEDFGVPDPRIAVCGLNPHAGEAGRFGAYERRTVAPAVEAARAEGLRCEGPVPADTVFVRMLKGASDGVVALYHDQGCIPVKLLAFETGVNVTLGLPIVRTSPDHGTAFDIARLGKADPRSLIAAIGLAVQMARRRPRKDRPAP